MSSINTFSLRFGSLLLLLLLGSLLVCNSEARAFGANPPAERSNSNVGEGGSNPFSNLLASASVASTATPACASATTLRVASGQSVVSVVGVGTTQVDRKDAKITFTFESKQANASTARDDVARALEPVVAALKKDASVTQLRTESVNLWPDYRYNPTNGSSYQDGFRFSTTLSFRVSNVESGSAARLVDFLSSNGASSISTEVVSSPDDVDNARLEALALATADALRTARALVRPLGFCVASVVKMIDQSFRPGGGGVSPGAADFAEASVAKSVVPVVGGSADVTAVVSFEFSFAECCSDQPTDQSTNRRS